MYVPTGSRNPYGFGQAIFALLRAGRRFSSAQIRYDLFQYRTRLRLHLLAHLCFGDQGTPNGEQPFFISDDNFLEMSLEHIDDNAQVGGEGFVFDHYLKTFFPSLPTTRSFGSSARARPRVK